MSRGMALLPAGVVTLLFVASVLVFFTARSGRAGTANANATPSSLRALAAKGDCELIELERARPTNPPLTGSFSERDRARDADYSRSRPPPLKAALHAMLHGRVLFQYKPGLRPSAVSALRRLYGEDTENVLLVQNQTQMRYEAAATAYLSAIVCRRLSPAGVAALRAFRERRRAFAQLP